MEIVNPQNLE